MILHPYRVAPSGIPGAGSGLFLASAVRRGSVLIAPDRIDRTLSQPEFEALPEGSVECCSSVRWFEQRYTVSPDWSDECYINHSFDPTGLWHLGFVFARADLDPGTEITMDYRYILGENCEPGFVDSLSRQRIVGLPWREVIRATTNALLVLLEPTGAAQIS